MFTVDALPIKWFQTVQCESVAALLPQLAVDLPFCVLVNPQFALRIVPDALIAFIMQPVEGPGDNRAQLFKRGGLVRACVQVDVLTL